MKLAISGKGGTGKTTIAALLTAELVRRGYRVTAIDADPDPCLAACLGFPPGSVTPLLDRREEIEERVGGGGFIRLNPRVDDLVGRLAPTREGVTLIVAGAISRGGSGCACPQAILLRSVLDHAVLERDEAVVVDLEAGVEPLGRRTAAAVDALLVVIDATRTSVETALRIRRLASDIGIDRVLGVWNRLRDDADAAEVAARAADLEVIGAIPYSVLIEAAELAGRPLTTVGGPVRAAVERLVDALMARCGPTLTIGAAAGHAAAASERGTQ
jgi:CO dehydrogenase maturation factor